MSPPPLDPAAQLAGLTLPNGWKVLDQITLAPGSSGSAYSYGYHVVAMDGRRAFLKALDFARAMKAADPARALQAMTQSFNFERDLLDQCRERKLSRVVQALDDGIVRLPGGETVQYLIFELADGDVRARMDEVRSFDLAWTLRSLHQVATGLNQLHRAGIAHQDVKPSNILTFGPRDAKICDLGKAAKKGLEPPHEQDVIAGDPSYAPPELLYAEAPAQWHARRMGCDNYHLGSMAMFFFTSVDATGAMFTHLDPSLYPGSWTDSYPAVVPYLRAAFETALVDFGDRVHSAVRPELVGAVRQLCEPDPNLRGHPRNRIGSGNRYSLERYVALFDRLAARAEGRMLRAGGR